MEIPPRQLQDAIVELVDALRNRSISASFANNTLRIDRSTLDVSFDRSGLVTLVLAVAGVFHYSATVAPEQALRMLDTAVQSMLARRK